MRGRSGLIIFRSILIMGIRLRGAGLNYGLARKTHNSDGNGSIPAGLLSTSSRTIGFETLLGMSCFKLGGVVRLIRCGTR